MNTIEDIEIYVKGQSLASLTSWLESCFDQVRTLNTGKVVHDLEVVAGTNAIPVMIVENAVGKAWSSIWFKTAGTTWKDDTDCAHSIHKYLQCRVRCNSGPWQEGADMDEWWQLTETGEESIIKWPNAS